MCCLLPALLMPHLTVQPQLTFGYIITDHASGKKVLRGGRVCEYCI